MKRTLAWLTLRDVNWRWPKAATIVRVLAVTAIVGSLLFVGIATFLRAGSTNETLRRFDDALSRSECAQTYATADRVSSSNLDITKAEFLYLSAESLRAGEEDAQLAESQHRMLTAVQERAEIAGIQARVNTSCAPTKEHLEMAPHVDPVVPLDIPGFDLEDETP